MAYDHSGAANESAARDLLRSLLPRARALASSMTQASSFALSSLGESAMGYYRAEATAGVHVYRGERGGWFADIAFDGVPEGISNMIGTPVGEPLPSREDAMAHAVGLLAILERNRGTPAPDPSTAVQRFLFSGLAVSIPVSRIAELRAAMPRTMGHDYVEKRLEQVRARYAGPDGLMTPEAVDALPEQSRREIMVVCTMAMAAGLLRWPALVEAAPR